MGYFEKCLNEKNTLFFKLWRYIQIHNIFQKGRSRSPQFFGGMGFSTKKTQVRFSVVTEKLRGPQAGRSTLMCTSGREVDGFFFIKCGGVSAVQHPGFYSGKNNHQHNSSPIFLLRVRFDVYNLYGFLL